MTPITGRRVAAACVAGIVAMTGLASGQRGTTRPAAPAPATEWPTYGHDPGGMRYSPLTQITPANVKQLEPAWVYHMKAPSSTAPGFASGETTALVINGVMFVSTPYGRVVALDPATGKEKWAFPLPSGSPSTRGVEYFVGDRQTPPQIVFGSSDGKLYSVDAVTGELNDKFGAKGVVDLNTPEIMQGLP